jgi:recombination protein RecT
MAEQKQTAIAIVTNKATLEGLMSKDTFKQSLAEVLPKHVTPERIVKMGLVAASRQPLLFKCTQASFLQSIMKSAELGLDCSGTLGRAYLVPYFNKKINGYECQFIPGYQGLIDLARRSGNIARIESRVVYEKDTFNVEYGIEQKLVHRPYLGTDRGNIQCVYGIAEMMDGSRQIEIMTIEEVNAIRDRSKAKDGGPWVTDFAEMARKTVIRRLAKYLPLSTELAKALEADDQQFHDSNGQTAATIADGVAGVAGLKDRINRKSVQSSEVQKEEPAKDQPTEPEPEPEVPEYDPAADEGVKSEQKD